MSSALAGIRKSPAAPLLPGHAGHGLVGFQLCGLSVVCGLCRASILAGLGGMQGFASPLRSSGAAQNVATGDSGAVLSWGAQPVTVEHELAGLF